MKENLSLFTIKISNINHTNINYTSINNYTSIIYTYFWILLDLNYPNNKFDIFYDKFLKHKSTSKLWFKEKLKYMRYDVHRNYNLNNYEITITKKRIFDLPDIHIEINKWKDEFRKKKIILDTNTNNTLIIEINEISHNYDYMLLP